MKIVTAIMAAAAALSAPVASSAQDRGEDNAEAPQAPVSDAEIVEYASLVIQGRGIQNNSTLSDSERQTAMAAILGASNMGFARFSEVSRAIGADTELQERLQSEVMRQLAEG